ncbi:MAG: beta strand repeat-containing protein, partial [Limisphaerales bacterium]
MKKLILAACALLACATTSKAQLLYWDRNGDSAGAGTPTGTWDAATANWTLDEDGLDLTQAWVPGATAVFSAGSNATGPFTVTVSGTRSVSSIIIEEGLVGFSGGILTNLGVVHVETGLTNYSTAITGTNTLIKRGPGTLRLDPSTNTYTGGTRLEEGTLAVATSTQFGAATAPFYFAGGTLDLPNIANRTINNPVVIESNSVISGSISTAGGTRWVAFSSGNVTNVGGSLTIRNTGAAGTFFSVRFREGGITINQPIALGQVGDAGTAVIRMDNVTGTNQTINGQISGPGIFERNNNTAVYGHRTILTAANTYSGGTDLKGGFIGIGNDQALGTGDVKIGFDAGHLGMFAHGAARTITNRIDFTSVVPATVNSTNFQVIGEHDLTLAGDMILRGNNATALTISNTGLTTISGVISGGAGLHKIGPGAMMLSGANTYAGATRVNGGTLRIGNSSGSATSTGEVVVASVATLTGAGSIDGIVTLSGKIAPGASVGTFSSGSQTCAAGSSFDFELNDATGAAGSDPGWDLINIDGTLTINATSANKLNINVASLAGSVAGPAANFSSSSPYSWTIVKTTGGIVGFDANNINFNTAGFQNNLNGGYFALALANGGNDLVLSYVEPPTAPV